MRMISKYKRELLFGQRNALLELAYDMEAEKL